MYVCMYACMYVNLYNYISVHKERGGERERD